MKTTRKIALFVALMSLFFSISLIQSTYAKYVSSATNNTNITIARWNILVNNQDVVSNSNFVNNITPVFTGNTNVADGKIAPTAIGYYDITIDASNTDVSLSYTVSIEESELNTVTDIEVYSYTIGSVTTDYTVPITGQIKHNDTNKTATIRFNVRWKDGTGETMNNAADTQSAQDGVAAIKTMINFVQSPN